MSIDGTAIVRRDAEDFGGPSTAPPFPSRVTVSRTERERFRRSRRPTRSPATSEKRSPRIAPSQTIARLLPATLTDNRSAALLEHGTAAFGEDAIVDAGRQAAPGSSAPTWNICRHAGGIRPSRVDGEICTHHGPLGTTEWLLRGPENVR